MSGSDLQIGAYTLDDDLIEKTRSDRKPRIHIYRSPGPWVVMGRGSKPELEINADACANDGVPVLKRRGGGCSVVIDPGNVIVSVALPVKGLKDNQKYFDRLSIWLIKGLDKIGINNIYSDGVSDLVLDDRKIGGSCIHRSKDLLYYSSTLLVQPDLEKVIRYLKHPPREPNYRKGRTHNDFMGALSPRYWAGYKEELILALQRELSTESLISPGS